MQVLFAIVLLHSAAAESLLLPRVQTKLCTNCSRLHACAGPVRSNRVRAAARWRSRCAAVHYLKAAAPAFATA